MSTIEHTRMAHELQPHVAALIRASMNADAASMRAARLAMKAQWGDLRGGGVTDRVRNVGATTLRWLGKLATAVGVEFAMSAPSAKLAGVDVVASLLLNYVLHSAANKLEVKQVVNDAVQLLHDTDPSPTASEEGKGSDDGDASLKPPPAGNKATMSTALNPHSWQTQPNDVQDRCMGSIAHQLPSCNNDDARTALIRNVLADQRRWFEQRLSALEAEHVRERAHWTSMFAQKDETIDRMRGHIQWLEGQDQNVDMERLRSSIQNLEHAVGSWEALVTASLESLRSRDRS